MATLMRTSSRETDLDSPRGFRRVPGFQTRIAVKWEAIVNFLVPIGYEDEAGFHYGWPAARRKSACVGAECCAI